ncbi:hypothetical protein MNBD_GAMMA21-139 [hydrothermal vent metagenome]|uniref:Uncharacterized protein n=1 Tax=hydrothermal vent metagenome TaxID=652676 RepID=A0A3B1A6K2_9ZZZZ
MSMYNIHVFDEEKVSIPDVILSKVEISEKLKSSIQSISGVWASYECGLSEYFKCLVHT